MLFFLSLFYFLSDLSKVGLLVCRSAIMGELVLFAARLVPLTIDFFAADKSPPVTVTAVDCSSNWLLDTSTSEAFFSKPYACCSYTAVL